MVEVGWGSRKTWDRVCDFNLKSVDENYKRVGLSDKRMHFMKK